MCVDKQEKKVKSLTSVCVWGGVSGWQLTWAHIYPKPTLFPAVSAEVRHPSLQSRCSKPWKVFVPHRSLRASAHAPPPPLENRLRRICSHVQQTAGEHSQHSQMSEVAPRARVRGVQMWAEPSRRRPESLLSIRTV